MRPAFLLLSSTMFFGLMLAGCTMPASPEEPSAEISQAQPDTAEIPLTETDVEIAEETPSEAVDLGEPEEISLLCLGALQQGGLVICEAAPGETVQFAGTRLTADETGTVQLGLTRSAAETLSVKRGVLSDILSIEPRSDEFRVLQGLDCDKIDARTPAQKAHAARSWEIKQNAFNQFHAGRGAVDGFIAPSAARPSSPFGPTRKYVGVSKTNGEPCESTSVHQGYDMAAPVGTQVVAPAAGVVTLADPDLYYEGGTIFLDHGHGLLSVFMHLSEVSVSAGDVVAQGAPIAKTGNTGRTTGPHLHWGVKWRNPASKDRGSDFYIDPSLLLEHLPAISADDAATIAP